MQNHIVLIKGVVGSRAYGIDSEHSDTDIKGICLGPANQYLGLEQFEQWINPYQDEVIYEVRKFVRLALASNPNIIELLWLPNYLLVSPLGQRLIDIRQEFLSIEVHRSFSGYAIEQIKKCKAKLEGAEFAGIKAKNPHKHAAHCMRLLRMGYELVTTGEMMVDRSNIDADELRRIRTGEISIEIVLAEAEEMLLRVDAAVTSSPLPKKPNALLVEKTLRGILWDYLLGEQVSRKGA